jgi:hypothetical protein
LPNLWRFAYFDEGRNDEKAWIVNERNFTKNDWGDNLVVFSRNEKRMFEKLKMFVVSLNTLFIC